MSLKYGKIGSNFDSFCNLPHTNVSKFHMVFLEVEFGKIWV